MRWRYIFSMVGTLLVFLGISMAFSLLVGLLYKDASVKPILLAMGVTSGAGVVLYGLFRCKPGDHISQRESMAIVTLGWIAMGVFGALPFLFSGVFSTFTDAVFESVSGFTTTGASVMTDIEIAPRGILFWRSFIQWLGGMGIIVLSIAILPFLGVGGMQLYKAEVPSPTPDKLKPRIQDTAKLLWKVYALLTLAQIVLLLLGGMSLYDALCHAFTTMPTGGFSTRNASIGAYQSVYIDSVVILFMLLAGINFALHFQLLRGNPLAFWRDPECRFFLVLVLILTFLITINVYRNVYPHIGESMRYAGFQVTSILTTTGFATADYEKWPAMSQAILFFCMFLGACGGSTGGGMKLIRIMLCGKFCYREIFVLIHPHAVTPVKLAGKHVPDDVIHSILGFLALYAGLFVVSAILLCGMGVDVTTSLGAVASSIGNIGPGFGAVGPAENYAQMPVLGKWLLVWCMLLGRLEIYTVMILLVPAFWRR